MEIKVLGPGCSNCRRLESMAREAVGDLGVDASIDKVTDSLEIAGYGVMSTPALVVDGRVVLTGLPTTEKLRSVLEDLTR